MAGKKKDLMDLRQLIQFKNQGLSNRKVAELLMISRNTVNHYTQIFNGFNLSYSELLSLDDQSLDELFPGQTEVHIQRFKTLSSYFEYYDKELRKPGCTLQALWEAYIQKHPDGYQSSQFNHHFNRWRGRVKSSGKLEHKAGEKLYIDFTGKRLQVVCKQTGEIKDVEVFVGILPSSQYTFVTAVESQKKEDLIKACIRCLEFFGGVPLAIVPDNLKAAVTKASKYQPEVNKTFKDFARHYGCSVAPTRTYSPKDKALVEGAVKLVYQRIFYPLNGQIFFNLEQLNRAIKDLLNKYNNQRFSQSTTTRNELFLSVEKSCLQALPTSRYQPKEFKRLKVQKMGYVYLSEDKHYYSVPFRFIGKQVKVQYTQKHLEIYFNYERVATHQRSAIKGGYTTIEAHLASKHRAFTSWNLSYFEQKALKIGENTCKYVSQMIQQQAYKEIGYKRAQGILMLGKSYGNDRVENACTRALHFEKHSYKLVESILKRGLDKPTPPYPEVFIPEHQNIRNNYK